MHGFAAKTARLGTYFLKFKVTSNSTQNFCVGILCFWVFVPQLSYSSIARVLSLIAICVWFVIEVFKSRGLMIRPTFAFLSLAIFSGYTITFELMTHGIEGFLSRIQLYIMLFFLIVQQARRNDLASLGSIFWLIIVLLAVSTTVTYLYVSTVNDRAMRILIRSSSEALELTEKGVGGYSLAYSAVLMLPVLTLLSFRTSLIEFLEVPQVLRVTSWLPRLLIWYVTGLSILLVFSSQFATAVITLTICLMIIFVLWRPSSFRVLLLFSLMSFMILFGKSLLIELLIYLAPIVDGTNYHLKVNDLLISLQMDSAGGTVSDRVERYKSSLILFLQNPFTGVLYFTDIGKHSTLLDTFARWGVFIGGIFLYLVTFIQVRSLRSLSSQRGGLGVTVGTLVAVLMVFGLNNAFMAAGAIIFILYPSVFSAMARSQMSQGEARKVSNHA